MGLRARHRHRCFASFVAFVLLIAAGSGAAQVYRSVDESGNVTFSDQPPAGAVEVTPVEIDPGPSDEQVQAAQERLEASREQLESIQQEREAAEERAREVRLQRLEEEALRAAARPSPQPQQPEPPRYRYYGYGVPGYPWTPGYPSRPPVHPGYPGYPVHPLPPLRPPVVRPPQRPEPPPRPKVLDSPLYNKSISPVYR